MIHKHFQNKFFEIFTSFFHLSPASFAPFSTSWHHHPKLIFLPLRQERHHPTSHQELHCIFDVLEQSLSPFSSCLSSYFPHDDGWMLLLVLSLLRWSRQGTKRSCSDYTEVKAKPNSLNRVSDCKFPSCPKFIKLDRASIWSWYLGRSTQQDQILHFLTLKATQHEQHASTLSAISYVFFTTKTFQAKREKLDTQDLQPPSNLDTLRTWTQKLALIPNPAISWLWYQSNPPAQTHHLP